MVYFGLFHLLIVVTSSAYGCNNMKIKMNSKVNDACYNNRSIINIPYVKSAI